VVESTPPCSTPGSSATTTVRRSSTRRDCFLPCRRSASACRRAPASPSRALAGLFCNGGPRNGPPLPPNARGAPAKPWRPSITGASKGGVYVLRVAAIRCASRTAEGLGEVHGRGDHPVPDEDGHGHPRLVRR